MCLQCSVTLIILTRHFALHRRSGENDADNNNGIYASTRWKGSGSFGYGSGSNTKDSIVLNVHKIPMNTQHMLVFSGLRGAVAFACASNFPDNNGNRDAILLVTMFVVLISVFALGSGTSKMLELLKIETDVNEEKVRVEYITLPFFVTLPTPTSLRLSSLARRSTKLC